MKATKVKKVKVPNKKKEKLLIKKPAKLTKPIKPLMPDVKPTITEEVAIFGRSIEMDTKQAPIPLLKALADMPEGVDLDDVKISMDFKDDYDYIANFRIFSSKELKNPAYAGAKADYENKLAKYEVALAEYEKQKVRNLKIEQLLSALALRERMLAAIKTCKVKTKLATYKKNLEGAVEGITELCKELKIDASIEDLEVE